MASPGECPLCECLIEVVRASKHLSRLERAGFEKILRDPLFGSRQLSVEAILQEFLIMVNTDPKATGTIQEGSLARALAGPW